MFIQVDEEKVMAYSAKPFEGFTKEVAEIDYDDYCENPLKYIFDGETIVLNPDYEKAAAEAHKIEEVNEIKVELEVLDLKSIRALRSGDTEYIKKYEEKAMQLRDRLAELG